MVTGPSIRAMYMGIPHEITKQALLSGELQVVSSEMVYGRAIYCLEGDGCNLLGPRIRILF